MYLTAFCLNCDYAGPGKNFEKKIVSDANLERSIISSIEALQLSGLAEATMSSTTDEITVNPELTKNLRDRVLIYVKNGVWRP